MRKARTVLAFFIGMNRTRTDPAVVTYGLYLYFNSRSFRLAAKSLAPIKRRSHVAVWKWVQRYADVADRFRTDRDASSGRYLSTRPCFR